MTRLQRAFKTTSTIFLILFAFRLAAQPTENEINQLNQLLSKGIELSQTKPDSALFIWIQCKDKSLKMKAFYQYAMACRHIGTFYAQAGKMQEALTFSETAVVYFRKLKQLQALSGALNLQGNIFVETDPQKALEKYYASIRISEAEKDCRQLVTTYNNVSIILNRMKHFGQALEYGRKYLDCAQKLNESDEIGYACSSIIDVFSERRQIDSMEKYVKIMQIVAGKTTDPYLQVVIENETGALYLKKKEYKKAIASFENAIRINKDLSDKGAQCQALANLGNVYVNDKQYDNARKTLLEAIKISKELGLRQHEKEASNLLAQTYERTGDFENAYNYHVKYKLLDDSLLNEESQNTMHQMEAQYQSEKKQASIELLQKKNALQEALTSQKQTERNLTLISSLAFVGFGMFFGNRFLTRRKMENQKALLDDRTRISRDLHDNIGSTLGSISFYSEMARKMQETKPEDLPELLRRIEESSRESVDNMGDIVWALKPENETLSKLVQRLKNYTADVLGRKGVEVHFVFDPNLESIKTSLENRMHLYLIAKEVLFNAAKYSEAKTVQINLESLEKGFRLTIQDDGKGFSISDVAEARNGNGLENIKHRAKEMNGRIQIQSVEKEGTRVILEGGFG